MAKALKVAAIVVGVAALAVVTGGAAAGLGLSLSTTFFVGGAYVSAGALALGAAGLSIGAALLTKKPSVTSAQTDRLFANVDPRTFRKTPLGQTALPVDVRYEEWSGTDQETCDWIVCHASCAIDGVEEIYFDTELVWTASAGTLGKYRGYFSVPNLILEGSPANAFTFASGKWNAATARLTGCAYARWRFKVTGNSKKAESPFASGLPSRITVIGRGAKLYDPRRDSTVPGGSGPMRAGDQSTWRYTADDGVVIGENLPLQILRVVLGWRITNPVTGEKRLATGSGVPARRLRLTSWITSANLADELVNRSAGGQEPRYHGAAVVSEGDDTKQSLDMLCAACCGRFRDTGGRLSLDIAHNDLAAAATDEGLLDDDVVGGFTWDPDPGFEGIPNVIRGRYVDATAASLYQLLDYPEVRIPSPDGIDRVMTLDLGAVESPSQAQRIVKQILQRKLYNRKFSAPFDIRAWKYPVGSLVPLTFAPLSFMRALFRVEAQELGQGGVCNMVLSFEHAAIYAWDKDDAAAVQAADPIVYDASKNPLILAIDQAGGTSTWDGVTGLGKPEDYATRGAPVGTAVGGRPVVDVLAGLDINTVGLLAEALRQDDLVQIFDARTLVDGQAVGVTFQTFRNEQITSNSAINSRLTLLGAKTADGTAWNLNLDTVRISADQTLGQHLTEIGVKADGLTASFRALQDVLIGPDGAQARFLFEADANGVIAGVYATATGLTSTVAIRARRFFLVDDTGGQSVNAIAYENGVWKMKIVEVEKFKALSVDTETLALFSISKPYSAELSSNLDLPTSGTRQVLRVTIVKDRADSDVIVEWYIRMRPGKTYAGYFGLNDSVSGDLDTVWYWQGKAEINNVHSIRTVEPYKRRFNGLAAGIHSFTLTFTFYGSDGVTDGFFEAGSGLFVTEVKR